MDTTWVRFTWHRSSFGLEKKSRLPKAYRADRLGRIAMACCKPPLSLQTEEMRKGDSLDLSPLSFYRQNIRWRNGTIVNRGSRSLLYFDRPQGPEIFDKFLYHRDYECKMNKWFQIPSLESQISMVGKVNYTRSGQLQPSLTKDIIMLKHIWSTSQHFGFSKFDFLRP